MSTNGSGKTASTAGNGRSDPGLSLVAAELTIHGSIESEGEIRILGRIEGDVSGGRVVIGPGARVGGAVAVLGPEAECLVAGEVAGPIRADRVEIRPEGAAAGGVAAREILISGKAAGGIVGEKVVLEEQAIVTGALRAESLSIAEGARLVVEVLTGQAAAEAAPLHPLPRTGPALVAEIVPTPAATLNSA